jgi:hypothetical protein
MKAKKKKFFLFVNAHAENELDMNEIDLMKNPFISFHLT